MKTLVTIFLCLLAWSFVASADTNATPQVQSGDLTGREPLTDSMMFTLDASPGGLAVQPDGKIVLGTTLSGFFSDEKTGMMGLYERAVMRLNPDGSLDRTFLSSVGPPANCDPARAHVIVSPEGKMFISGLFRSIGGQPRPGYAMLLANGELDTSFEPWRGSTNVPQLTYLPGGTFPATWLPDGSISIMSEPIMEKKPNWVFPMAVYRLDSTGNWIGPTNQLLASEFLRPSGLIVALGPAGFSPRVTIDWTNAVPAARNIPPTASPRERSVWDIPFGYWTAPPSAPDAAKVFQALFEEVPIELCRYAVQLSDGGAILAIRDKANTGMTAPGRFMRFNKNWEPDFSFTNSYEVDLRSALEIKRQRDGKFLVSGLIGQMDGEDFPGIVRLDEHGLIDRGFRCVVGPTNSLFGCVMDIAIQDDNRILICGRFSSVNGVEVPHIARLNPDGSLDQTFKPSFMTLAQFNRNSLEKKHRVPVAQLSKPPLVSSTTTTTTTTIAPGASTILITSLEIQGATAVVQFIGDANQQYILQAKDAMNNAEWINVATNTATATGTGGFRDSQAENHPTRLYRIAKP